jgi:hypothetical protein
VTELTPEQIKKYQDIIDAVVEYTFAQVWTRMFLMHETFDEAFKNHIDELIADVS